jgi:SAM-dependent methyltransferase
MTNDYIDHYDKYKISPVRQELNDFDKHVYIRRMLYQALGLPKTAFKGKNVLEVGAGGGYNAIVTATFEPAYYQLIDANETGAKEITELFDKHNISCENIDIKNCFIEEYHTEKKFDIVICENMLSGIKNKYEVIQKLDTLIAKDGIFITNCSDEVSIFYDITRRLFANILSQRVDNKDFEYKLDIFEEAFKPHLETLDGFSKILRDWCADNLMDQAIYNVSLSVGDIVNFLGDKYYFYQMTPTIIVDEQWYKEVAISTRAYNERKASLYERTWHNVFHYKVTSCERDSDKNIQLRMYCRQYIDLIQESENNYTNESKKNILEILRKIDNNLKDIDEKISLSIQEIINFLEIDNVSVETIKTSFTHFKSAFGKALQFVSLVKSI